ncbi:thioesterase family protein [Epibacterium sp. Ofav1-8]|uniref:thioesterase family protein n=1 Tax=Epibacterium sp. Ofav1-8 TaxID=2917735 RepID=UPI001EF4A4EB|nr:thioesterase family protein [Epibacterium sp. Ofav1-8]MCG7625150.1 thioesterase family protein [Epibacterium sp. Ofav1-8]
MSGTATSALGQVVNALAVSADTACVTVPDGWAQGQTAFGGFTAAMALSSAQRVLADLPPLRFAQMTYLRPVVGALRFAVTKLREGRSGSFVRVECTSSDALVFVASFGFFHPRPSGVAHRFVPFPDVPPPASCPDIGIYSGRPDFLSRFDMRLGGGALPVTGSDCPEITLWSRLAQARDLRPDVALLAVADSHPPAVMTALPDLAPLSTISWDLALTQVPPTASAWICLQASSRQAQDGYSLQETALFDADGAFLGWSHQTVAVFG